MSEQAIEIEFTPTPEDVVAVRVHAVRGYDSPKLRSLARRRSVFLALFMTPMGALAAVGAIALFVIVTSGGPLKPGFLAALGVFGALWGAQVLRAATAKPMSGAAGRRFERVVRRTTDTTGLTLNLYRLDDEGVTHENDGIVMFFPWGSIKRASRDDGAWYLHASNEMVLRLPDRAVPDGEALRALIGERVREGGA